MATQKSTALGRGAAFPTIGLAKAIEYAKQLEIKEKRNYARMARLAEIWGSSPKSSSVALILASLRAYGLFDFKGSGDDRQARISDRAHRIIHNAPDAPHQRHAAALAAPLHKGLWERYRDDWPPSDENVRDYLAWELKKMETGPAFAAAKQFKATIKYAGLDGSSEESNDSDNKELFEKLFARPKGGPKQTIMRKEVTTIGDHEAAISWPSKMTADDYADFKYWLNGVIRKAARAAGVGQSENDENDDTARI